MRTGLVAVAALLALTGCARYWARPGGTDEAFDAARARCVNEAAARYPGAGGFPPDLEMLVPKPDLCTAGVRHTICQSNGGSFMPPAIGTGLSPPARQAFATCMASAGWLPVANATEGDRVTHGQSPIKAGG